MKQGDILSYSPDLEIYTEPSTDVVGNELTYSLADDITISDDPNKSLCIKEFEFQLPSTKINNATKLLTQLTTYMDNIESSIMSNDYGVKYFSATTDEEADNILQANKTDLTDGSTKLEIYSILEKIQDEVKQVLELYITCMFGKDVDTDSVTELVTAYVDKINQYESNGEYKKINYFSIYYDTQISYAFGEYIKRLGEVSAELSFINDKSRNLDVNDINTQIFKDAFSKVNFALDFDLYKDEDTTGNISISMKNIFLTKQKINSYLEVFSTLYTLEDGANEISEIRQDNIDDLESKLDALIRTTMYSSLTKTNICGELQKKANYRSFFIT